MAKAVKGKGNSTLRGQSGKRNGLLRRNKSAGKADTRASDVYEAEDGEPAEELEAGRRYDVCIRSHDSGSYNLVVT